MADKKPDEIYIRSLPYQTGGIVKSASSLSPNEFANLESSALGLPKFPNVHLNITSDEIKLMSIMMNHVTIERAHYPKRYIHSHDAIILAATLSKKKGHQLNLSDSVQIIQEKCNEQLKPCTCSAHIRLQTFDNNQIMFETTLGQLQLLNIQSQVRDQTGSQALVEIMTFLSFRQKWRSRCSAKAANLQTSCAAYNAKKEEIQIYNSTPDFLMTGVQGNSIVVGEVESSPWVQMVVAGFGHMSDLNRYLLGMCLSKERVIDLYFIENERGMKIRAQEVYIGKVTFKKANLSIYSLLDADKLAECLERIVQIVEFIIEDFEERADQSDDISYVQHSPTVLRRSERKRTSSSLKKN